MRLNCKCEVKLLEMIGVDLAFTSISFYCDANGRYSQLATFGSCVGLTTTVTFICSSCTSFMLAFNFWSLRTFIINFVGSYNTLCTAIITACVLYTLFCIDKYIIFYGT